MLSVIIFPILKISLRLSRDKYNMIITVCVDLICLESRLGYSGEKGGSSDWVKLLNNFAQRKNHSVCRDFRINKMY